jgi:hypothetical protein
MFDWLAEEIEEIQTPRFHVVEGVAGPKLRSAIEESTLQLPISYKTFVMGFGNSKLYRTSLTGYRVGVFAGPRKSKLEGGIGMYHIGFNDGAAAYLKTAVGADDPPIFELEGNSQVMVADNFAEWLITSCARARKKHGKKEWAEILHGPAPFSPQELEIVEVRRKIQWRVVGIDSEGNHVFEVRNTANRILPLLTVGVRSNDGRLNGAVVLKIGQINPGQMALLHADCYKQLVPPNKIEVFGLPDPRPEDRSYYREFKKEKGAD